LIGHLTQVIFDPLFAALFKEDLFYANSEMTKFSVVKLSEEYRRYSEGIKEKYEGYDLDKNSFVENKNADV
jgi:hypothetical protein